MPLNRKLRAAICHLPKSLDISSLQFRLTAEIAVLAVLGLGSLAVWTGWKMQQVLIVTHQQHVEYIATRFPRDVELYSDMLPVKAGLQKTIDNVSIPQLLIWVKGLDGQLLARSISLDSSSSAAEELMSLAEMPLKPQVYRVGDRYLILYESPIRLKGKLLGNVYMAQDVTADQRQFYAAMQSLAIVCVLAIGGMMSAIALRIRRSLHPLKEMSRMAGIISATELRTAKLQLSHAPSEVRALTQAFNMMLSRLADAQEQQRQFVSDVSHELRTPLTVVVGYLQSLLRRSPNLNDYQREALSTAAAEADRTVRMLQDLLDLARSDSGHMYFQLKPVVLNDLVAEATDMAQQVGARQITVTEAAEITAIADRDRLKQVLINLIDNAVKYSEPDQPILLKLSQIDEQAVIQVCDRGIGIPLPDQSRIFERFYRVDESRTRSTGGHGLGLAIVKTLVEGMGGSITVRSKPSQGSTFTIYLRVVITNSL
ncbi:MAG: HAMP domain-containing histidine kinase [Aphanocapsa sp. GSE-SYN-MK-11-07L]|jgi:signal transduction histidine kinase|nr:HAMP domain-containing histidine kinase [Aphanocapsa sp. GSE-SYN-MK-11-07L]